MINDPHAYETAERQPANELSKVSHAYGTAEFPPLPNRDGQAAVAPGSPVKQYFQGPNRAEDNQCNKEFSHANATTVNWSGKLAQTENSYAQHNTLVVETNECRHANEQEPSQAPQTVSVHVAIAMCNDSQCSGIGEPLGRSKHHKRKAIEPSSRQPNLGGGCAEEHSHANEATANGSGNLAQTKNSYAQHNTLVADTKVCMRADEQEPPQAPQAYATLSAHVAIATGNDSQRSEVGVPLGRSKNHESKAIEPSHASPTWAEGALLLWVTRGWGGGESIDTPMTQLRKKSSHANPPR